MKDQLVLIGKTITCSENRTSDFCKKKERGNVYSIT